MSKLDELKKLAEVALAGANGDEHDWYDLECLETFLIVEETQANGPFMAAVSPAVVLRLLEMIKALRSGLQAIVDGDTKPEGRAGLALEAVDDIERRLGE